MKNCWLYCMIAIVLIAVVGGGWMSKKLHADDAPQLMPVQAVASKTNVKPSSATTNMPVVVSPGEIAATPEMWFYEQAMRRYDDPKNAIRAAAELKANQRRSRIAAMEWYGYSNLRPASGIDSVDGPLSPQWIGNGYNPYTWVTPARTAAVWVIPGVSGGY